MSASRPARARLQDKSTEQLVADSIGGVRGIVDATIPSLGFVLVYAITKQVRPSVIAAVATALALLVVRLVRRQPAQQTFAGLVFVGISAFVASRTGSGKDFYVPSLLRELGLVVLYLGSVVVRRPLFGFAAAVLTGRTLTGWWGEAPFLRAARTTTLLFTAISALRLAVQLPLYLAGATTALGFVRIAMGLPLAALVTYICYGLFTRVGPPPAPVEEPVEDPAPAADETAGGG